MAARTNNDELIPKSVLEQLAEMEKLIVSNRENLVKMLDPIEKSLNLTAKYLVSYKDLTEEMNKQERIRNKIIEVVSEEKRILTEREKLIGRITSVEAKQTKEVAKLRLELQQLTREEKEQVKVEQAQAKLSGENAKNIELLRLKVSQLKREWLSAEIGSEKFKQLSEELKKANKELTEAEKKVGIFSRNVGNYGTKIFSSLRKVVTGFFSVNTVINGLKNASRTIADFEQANADLASILGKSRKEITSLTDSAKQLGATTEYTATQVTGLQTELAKLGFSEEQIRNMQKPVLQFATAVGTDLPSAAALAGASLRAFGLDSKETERLVSVMAVGTTKSALSFSYLDSALSTVSPVAKSFGFTIEDTVALLGTLADSGFDASTAATATRNILLNLADANGKLAKSLGRPVKSLDDLITGLQDLRSKGVDLNTTLELTDKRSVAAFNTFLDGAENVKELRDELSDTGDQLKQIQEERLDTLKGSVKLLESAWEGLMLSFSKSSGVMKNVADGLTVVLNLVNRLMDSEGYAEQQLEEQYNKRLDFSRKLYKDIESDLRKLSETNDDYIFDPDRVKEKYKSAVHDEYVRLIAERDNISAALINAEAELESKRNSVFGFGAKRAQANVQKLQEQLQDAGREVENIGKIMEQVLSENSFSESETAGTGFKLGLSEKELSKLANERLKQKEAETRAQQQIADLTIQIRNAANQRVIRNEKESLETRLAALAAFEKDSQELIRQQGTNQIQNLIDKAVNTTGNGIENEVQARKALASQIMAIEYKMQNDISAISTQGSETRRKLFEADAKKQLAVLGKSAADIQMFLNTSEKEEAKLMAEQFKNREITQSEYEVKKVELARKYAKESFQAQAALLRQQLDNYELTAEEREDIERRITQEEIKYNQKLNDEKIKADEEYAQKRIQLEQQLSQQIMSLQRDVFNLISTLASRRAELQLRALNKESETNTEYYDEERARIERLYEAGAISKEQADARKALVDQNEKEREEDLEQQKKEILYRQAKLERDLQLAQIAFDLASAIFKITATALALKANPVTALLAPFAYAQIPIAVASSSLQTAAIMATPLPEYAQGTDYHPGGPAIVGDGGRPEMVLLPSGQIYKTPAMDTILNLPVGTQVLPDYYKAIESLTYPSIDERGRKAYEIKLDNSGTEKLLKANNEEIRKLHVSYKRDNHSRRYTSHFTSTIPIKNF